jgi:hypothetical protein
VESGALTFRPRFPIAPGLRYRAVFRTPDGVHAELRVDGPPRPVERITQVERVYPSTDVLPSNALRLYIYFSAPMSRGEAWEHIRLIDETTNRPVEMPFLELDQELWDRDQRRLTVLFDPGRIKRGLVPTTTIGPALVEGRRYRLIVDREWHDARGVGLVQGFEKVFRGGPSDRVAPEPARWNISAPKAGTIEPLIVAFPKPMDYVLVQRMITIYRGSAEVIGTVRIERGETELRFTPQQPWAVGLHRIVADNTLEDIAGNHLDRQFDVDRFERITERIGTATTSIPFDVH